MPMHYRIDEELGIVITTAEGEVSREDLLRHAQALLDDAAAQGLNEMVDMSGREKVSVTTRTIQATADLLREGTHHSGGKLALVADADSVFGMARLYQAHRSHPGIEINVFRERRKALAWLGVAADV